MTTDTVDAEVVEMPPQRAVVVQHPGPVQAHLAVGVGALASMSDEDFERNLEAMRKGVQRAARMKEAIMVEDEDYGLIPGTKKPTLLKPGAEKLALAYGLTGRFEHHIAYGHAADEPPITVVVDCFLHLGGHDGPVVAQGMGSASSFENRYRWRKAGRMCPDCGKEGVIYTKGRGGQWWHPTDAKPSGGCGANFPKDDERLSEQGPGQIENPDPHELGNTLLKMAEKRSYVDAVLRGTASSGLFSQDMEDMVSTEKSHVDQETGEIIRETVQTRGPHVVHPVADASPEQAIANGRWSDGPGTWRGTGAVDIGADGDIREDPDHGWRLVFSLNGDPRIGRVVAFGQLALDIHDAIANDGRNLAGLKLAISGELFREPWTKDGRTMPAKREVILSRIEAPRWTLPAEETVASQAAERVAAKRAERVAAAATCGSVAADGLMAGAVCSEPPHDKGPHKSDAGSWPR